MTTATTQAILGGGGSGGGGSQRPAEDPWTADPSDGFGGDAAPDEPPF